MECGWVSSKREEMTLKAERYIYHGRRPKSHGRRLFEVETGLATSAGHGPRVPTGDWRLETGDWGPPRDQRPGCGREGRRSLATSVCNYRTDAGLPRNPMLRRGSPRRPSQLPGARAETALRRGRAQDGHVRGGECSSVVRLTGGLRVCWTRGDGRGGQASAKGEPCRETRLNLLLGVASTWPHPPLCLRAGPTGLCLSRLAARLLS